MAIERFYQVDQSQLCVHALIFSIEKHNAHFGFQMVHLSPGATWWHLGGVCGPLGVPACKMGCFGTLVGTPSTSKHTRLVFF